MSARVLVRLTLLSPWVHTPVSPVPPPDLEPKLTTPFDLFPQLTPNPERLEDEEDDWDLVKYRKEKEVEDEGAEVEPIRQLQLQDARGVKQPLYSGLRSLHAITSSNRIVIDIGRIEGVSWFHACPWIKRILLDGCSVLYSHCFEPSDVQSMTRTADCRGSCAGIVDRRCSPNGMTAPL